MKKRENYLGIIDWGIGGTSVYKLIKQRRPDTPVIYFSDTGVTPYGKMSRAELTKRLNDVISWMKLQGASQIVIGCNAASTAIDDLKDQGINIYGVIEPAVKMVRASKCSKIALIGGKRTVLSRIHARKLPGVKVTGRVAQPLSALIESGDLHSEKLQKTCAGILRPVRNAEYVLLACTHYPAVLPILQKQVNARTKWLDPVELLVDDLLRLPALPSGKYPDLFYTSGDVLSMKRSASRAFGVHIKKARKVSSLHSK